MSEVKWPENCPVCGRKLTENKRWDGIKDFYCADPDGNGTGHSGTDRVKLKIFVNFNGKNIEEFPIEDFERRMKLRSFE